MMAIANESDHVYDVMAEALNHLSRVVEHVRDLPWMFLHAD